MYKAKKKEKEKDCKLVFLRDVGVIWYNSLGDSHFQTCVMNNLELLIDYYLHIILYVSHALTSCTHITSNFFISFDD